MESKISRMKEKYKSNPAWCWLLITVFSFFLLPEYIAPFVLFCAFIIFKRQWKKEGRLAKVGNIGKLEMAFMAYMLISVIWSQKRLDTLGSAGLWWAVILIQVMVYNLARTKEKIDRVIKVLVASAAINGIVGAIQFVTFVLSVNKYTPQGAILVTPFYRYVDTFVYEKMPFKISTFMWTNRASAFFSNPNLLATFMLVAFPLGVYLYLGAKDKKSRNIAFVELVCISFGMASTQTRAGCYVIIAAWAAMFVIFIKRHALRMLVLFIPAGGSSIFALLTRYAKINIYPNVTFAPVSAEEALLSSARHFEIWKSLIDYLTHHGLAFVFGTGFGCEQTGFILENMYDLKKPHAHNFVIEIWMELGLIGIVVLGVIICYAIGKMLEIDLASHKAVLIQVSVLASFVSLLVFGLSDYIFNSPKQIILFTFLIGLIQAVSYTYDKHEIQTAKDLRRIAKANMQSLIHQ